MIGSGVYILPAYSGSLSAVLDGPTSLRELEYVGVELVYYPSSSRSDFHIKFKPMFRRCAAFPVAGWPAHYNESTSYRLRTPVFFGPVFSSRCE